MFEELGISTSDSVLAAFNAVCDLKEETERLQAACAAKEAELYELRSRTAELFGERLSAEGADEDAVQAAKAMWLSEPAAAAHAALGCDIVEAANPWGCNQYGHRKGHSGGVGGTDAKNREARSNLSDSDADFLTSDAYEIAMEEGGYEILYDTPKEKVKKAIRDTLKETGSASMLEGDTSALYSWWKKNKEKVVNKLKAESLQASNKHACEQERELYSAEDYDALECSHTLEELLEDEEVAAANPYGCNQYGHEWRMPHGGKSPSPKQPELQRVPGGRAFGYRPAKQEKAKSPEKKTEKVPEHKTETREAYKDNPNFKREVNNYIRRMKDITSREKTAYKEITSGKLSDEQTQQKLKEWADAQNEYYQVLQEFANEGVQLDIDESDEISKLDIQSEDQIMQHFEDIEKRYPQAVK